MTALPALTVLTSFAVSGAWLALFLRADLPRELLATALLHPEHYA